MNSIDLNLDEENELTFQVNVEGTRPATAKCRLAIQNDDLSLLFEAEKFDDDNVSVVLPPLKHVLKEGEYNMTLEVIVEDKYFTPLSIVGNFEKSIKITAESVSKKKKPKLNATASLVNRKARKKVLSEKKEVKKQQSVSPVRSNNSQNRSNKISDKQIMDLINLISKKVK